MAKVKITLVKSLIDRGHHQKSTAKALGLTRPNTYVEKEVSPQIQGMINQLNHLITVEEIG